MTIFRLRVGLVIMALSMTNNQDLCASFPENQQKKTDVGLAVQTGTTLARYHNTCLDIRSFFASGEFFHGLRLAKTPTGQEATKGQAVQSNFPERLYLDLQITPYPCTPDQPISPGFGDGLIKRLMFILTWKFPTETRPAPIASTRLKHEPLQLRWDYFLEIHPKEIALDSELTIDIALAKQVPEPFCRLSAKLK